MIDPLNTQRVPLMFDSAESDDNSNDNSTAIFWTKIGFCIFAFFEAAGTGLFPTYSKSCRESPKVLGVANAFAGGVFIAIALMHILPEQIEGWTEYEGGFYTNALTAETEDDLEVRKVFPLPEVLAFVGYALILLLDKVMFDSHALFKHDNEEGAMRDPAARKLQDNMKASFSKMNRSADSPEQAKKSMQEARDEMQQEVKSYLNPHDRFANRMKASLSNG